MKWIKESDISAFLSRHNYDIRVSGNARWIDQKCAADVVTIVSDCIVQYEAFHPGESFTADDIWHNAYTVANVADIFKKPSPNEGRAVAEYNKFFMQPMEMLAYAGVLSRRKQGRHNRYSIIDRELLEYLSFRERNTLSFLQMYITAVLTDSGLMPLFENFFQKQNKDAYNQVKDGFTDFTIHYTKIKGQTECRRIFIKVLNPLAYQRSKYGTEKGRLSRGKITYDMLMYNRDNFRDVYTQKPKELTRQQYIGEARLKPSSGFNAYMSQKAKRLVRAFNDSFRCGRSEVYDERHNADMAIHMHHIFPEAEFPEISAYYENLIALTPTQHFNYAHPLGNTGKVSPDYQHICLIAKAAAIKETMEDSTREQIYEFGKFLHVCSVGLDNEIFTGIEDRDFDGVVTAINLTYAAMKG